MQLHSMHIGISCPRQSLQHRFTCLHMLYTYILNYWQDHSSIISRKIFRVQSLSCKVLPLPPWMNQTLALAFLQNAYTLCPLTPSLHVRFLFHHTLLAMLNLLSFYIFSWQTNWLRARWYWLYLICFLFIFLNHSVKFPSHWFLTMQLLNMMQNQKILLQCHVTFICNSIFSLHFRVW